MIELECPWCREAVHVDPAVLADSDALRCDACRVEVPFADSDVPMSVALAA